MTLLFIYLFGAMFVCALCSILETALMSTPLSYVTMREEQGYSLATRFRKYKDNPSRPIAAILLLNTIASTVGAIGVGHQVGTALGSQWLGIVSTITTALMLIFSEIIPKNYSAARWKHLMGFTTVVLNVLIICLFPIVVIVEWIGKLFTPKNSESVVSRDEVSAMANEAEKESAIDKNENTLIQNIIRIDQMKAEDAMTPRVVCAAAPESMTAEDFYRSGEKDEMFLHHSRFPVYAESVDYITGYVVLTDILKLLADGKGDTTLGSIRRDINLFSRDTTLGEIWDVMLLQRVQICCVIDEYGTFQGILTLEDLVETLVGNEIVNEIDMVTDMQQYARDRWNQRQQKTVPEKKADPEKNLKRNRQPKRSHDFTAAG